MELLFSTGNLNFIFTNKVIHPVIINAMLLFITPSTIFGCLYVFIGNFIGLRQTAIVNFTNIIVFLTTRNKAKGNGNNKNNTFHSLILPKIINKSRNGRYI